MGLMASLGMSCRSSDSWECLGLGVSVGRGEDVGSVGEGEEVVGGGGGVEGLGLAVGSTEDGEGAAEDDARPLPPQATTMTAKARARRGSPTLSRIRPVMARYTLEPASQRVGPGPFVITPETCNCYLTGGPSCVLPLLDNELWAKGVPGRFFPGTTGLGII